MIVKSTDAGKIYTKRVCNKGTYIRLAIFIQKIVIEKMFLLKVSISTLFTLIVLILVILVLLIAWEYICNYLKFLKLGYLKMY